MIHLGKDVKLHIKPVLVTLHHDYVFEGPCRMGKGFELTKEFDDMANQELVKGAKEEIAENLTSPHFHVMEPVWVDRNEEFLVTPEIMEEMLRDRDQVDVYLVGPMGRLTDLMIDFAQKAGKPMISIPGPQCMQTIMISATRARGLHTYAFRSWKETVDFLEVMRTAKMLRETRVLCAARFGTTRSVSDMGNFVNLEHVTDVLGTQFTFVNLHELIDQTHIGKSGENYTRPGRPESHRRGCAGDGSPGGRPDGQRGGVRHDPGGGSQLRAVLHYGEKDAGLLRLQCLCGALSGCLRYPPAQRGTYDIPCWERWAYPRPANTIFLHVFPLPSFPP